MRMLSVIVPCYNEEESVADFYQELMKNDAFFKEKELEVEVLFIDDGSRDNTAAEVKKLREADPRVRLISIRVFLFPGISGRRRAYTRVWKNPGETMRF